MKTRWLSLMISVFTLAALFLPSGGVQAQTGGSIVPNGGGGPGPISSAFTYQGMLRLGGVPVNGNCDMQFSLFNQALTPGTQIGSTETQTNVVVSNGLFTVVLNYSGQFDSPLDPIYTYGFVGDMRWLQIAVRCPAGGGIYTPLTPRQPLWAAPYAITLMPGAHIVGAEYQNLKVVSYFPDTGLPAAVTGEIRTSIDGVGVYGSNEVNTTGATGIGVWGRTWSPSGSGVKGTGNNGATGVFGESYGEGHGVEGKNNNLYAAAILAQNYGGGDHYRALDPGSTVVFRVQSNGAVWAYGGYSSGGADLAEKFSVSSSSTLEPGTLMVIDVDHPGQLKPSEVAYDNKVAGIVSGAGGLQPGVTLSDQDGVAIALAGRVYVKAEAFSGAIEPGDLLTSSSIPGYAMKASDHERAVGAVIGKAMIGLESGTGLVLVLVSLQ